MSIEENQWKDTLNRLAEGDPADWPTGVRNTLHSAGPAAPSSLDRFQDLSRKIQDTSTVVAFPRPSRLPAKNRAAVLPAAAAVLIALGLGLWSFNRPGSESELAVLRLKGAGEVLRAGSTRDLADGLSIGDEVRLTGDSALELSFAGGVHLQLIGPARIELRPGTSRASAKTTPSGSSPGPSLEFHLHEGEVFFVSRKRAAADRFTLSSARAHYALAGTAGLLTVRPQVESLRVVEGAVDVRPAGTTDVLRVPEANWVLVERPRANPAGPLPELNPSDPHSFQMLCHRRDRLLTFVKEETVPEARAHE